MKSNLRHLVKRCVSVALSALLTTGVLLPLLSNAKSYKSNVSTKNLVKTKKNMPVWVDFPGVALPTAGTYKLPVIQPASNGWVLEGNKMPWRLSRYTKDAITLLSFMYTYCSDPLGCPLAYSTMVDIKNRVLLDNALHGKVRFVSLSFDPTNDTPQMMRTYSKFQESHTALDWHYLTTYSTRILKPILDNFGQDIEVELDRNKQPTRMISHMLKVFLIDQHANVREIYSTGFMNAELIFNDIKTLALESQQKKIN
jgi:protein SCO1